MKFSHQLKWLLAGVLLLGSGWALAQNLPLVTSTTTKAGTVYSVPVQTLLAMTALSFLPAALMLMTSFTRILIVFSLLRQALGLQSMPPNIVLIGLSLFLTLFIMTPVFEPIYRDAYLPLVSGKIGFEEAVTLGSEPLKQFMLAHTRQDDLSMFARLWGQPIETRADVPMSVLIPAFAISEIKTGFLIGFLIYLPFLAIDFAVASILTSLGMVMVSPMMFSLPLKLVVFALADGWALLAASLVNSFRLT
jgi:flagellar biosynthetic protein FliP